MAPPGLLRLNERSQRPNVCINFIKPLTSVPQADQEIAKDFLERLAAQCYPVMKKNYITVMSLEEFEYNTEFAGRNFNAGECIQIVLKDRTGRWLPFNSVQMVMMHELAHCKQMNHSRNFWKVRNQYADEMKDLWAKKYEGEGLWGRGRDLSSGAFMHDNAPDAADLPAHECGGVYRTARGRKRRRGQSDATKPKLTYAERQQKRIAKKFGSHGDGHSVGEDELLRGGLEQGKRSTGKPRVAQSKRGRELRANAALARFEAAKNHQQQQTGQTPNMQDDDGSETESGDDDDSAVAIFNTLEKIKDQRGRELYKVCGHEGEEDEGGEEEDDDFRALESTNGLPPTQEGPSFLRNRNNAAAQDLQEDSETESEDESLLQPGPIQELSHTADPVRPNGKSPKRNRCKDRDTAALAQASVDLTGDDVRNRDQATTTSTDSRHALSDPAAPGAWGFENVKACPICSLENEPDAPTCLACSHVLKPSLVPDNWRCNSDVCKGSAYVNAGDAGRCGVCGSARPAAPMRPVGVVGADVLRWD